MKKHVKIYFDHFGYGEQDFIPCEECGGRAVDIHHVKFRSRGGGDEIENLVALCRKCHNNAHSNPVYNKKIRSKHMDYLRDKHYRNV